MIREIGEFKKSGVKLQCLTEERERLLVRVIGRPEKMRVREIGIPLYIVLNFESIDSSRSSVTCMGAARDLLLLYFAPLFLRAAQH